jgi:ubiquinone/menaquinone biosynthesis C-methylase UbiE
MTSTSLPDSIAVTTSRDADVVARYSRLAFLYDFWTTMTESRSLRVALERAEIRDGQAVLEVAVGTGVLFRKILRANRSGRNVGVDLTEGMLRRARRKAMRTGVPHELLVGDARRLAFGDGTFDLVFNNNMLGIVPPDDVAPILREFGRVLRPGGRLVIVSMARPEGCVAGSIYGLGACKLGKWTDVEVGPFLRSVGFEVQSEEVVRQLGIPSDVLVAQKAPARTT